MGSLTESLNQFKTNHENTIVIISMRFFWTLWILCVLLFCERVGSEKRITALDQDQENQLTPVEEELFQKNNIETQEGGIKNIKEKAVGGIKNITEKAEKKVKEKVEKATGGIK